MYVIVGGRPILERRRAPELVRKRLAVLDYVEKWLQDPAYLSSYAPGEAEAHRQRVREAREQYMGLLR